MIYFMINQTKKSLCQKIETVQYSAALAITIAIKDASHIKLYNELGFYNLLSLNGGSENCVCFIRLKRLVYRNIYSIWYHKGTISTRLGQLRMLRFIAKQMHSNVLISHIPIYNGTNLVCK